MEYVVLLLILLALPFAFMRVYGRRVARFKGPWIVEEPQPAPTGGLVFEPVSDHRRLLGLSREETSEFEQLDRSAVAPASTRETRWLELYLKHQAAQKAASRPPELPAARAS